MEVNQSSRKYLVKLCLAGLALMQFATPPVSAQQQLEDVFFPAPREQRQRLSRAAQALEAGQYSDAVIALGELLSGEGEDMNSSQQQDFFLGATSKAGTRESLKAKAQQMLGEMNSEGRKLYELRFGPQAKTLLATAIQNNDYQKLVDITRRYFHTEAGYEATILLGRRHLGEGRPLAAAMNLQRLARWPAAAEKFDPQLSLMLATAWMQAGIEDKAEQTLLDLKRRKPNAGVRIAGKNVNLFAKDSEALTWLRQWAAGVDLRRTLDQEQWVMHRGNPRRNASTSGDLPLLSDRWRVPTVNDPDEEALVAVAKRQKRSQDVSTISSLHPLAVGDQVIMRTPDQLWAVDFETGSRIWEWPWRRSTSVSTGGKAGSPRAAVLDRRLWADASYGQMASDGESLYFLADQSVATGSSAVNRMVGMPAGALIRFNNGQGVATSANELMCLSLRREGAIRWSVGGKDGGFEPELAGAFFLGAPLPLQGRLYVLAELKSEVRLVVLNARDGELLWQQQLAHLDNNILARAPLRRLAGATPSFSDGVLVCPTGAGAVVGLDIATRSLLWGYQYNSNFINARVSYGRSTPAVKDKWLDASPTIADKWVLLTPPESDELHCLDLLTGTEAKWSPVKRGDLLYVAAVVDNKAVLVGKSEVRALDLGTGQPAWDPIKLDDANPSGQGFLSDGHYFLPTSTKKILKIHLATGKKAAEVETNRELGNLICYNNNVISQSTEWVSAYYQRDFLREEVEARLEKDGNDSWALARKCELLLQDGKRDEALVVLRKTHKLQPENDVVRTLLVNTLLGLLREDFQRHSGLIDEVTPLIDHPRERNEFAKLRAVGLEQAGRIREAFEAVVDLLPQEGTVPTLEEVDANLQVRRDRWAAARIAALVDAAQGDDAAHIAEIVRQHLSEAVEHGTPNGLRKFLNRFGHHPLAREARLNLAEMLLGSQEFLAAELELEGVDTGDDAIAGRAVALRARLLFAAGFHHEAARQYQRLAKGWPALDISGVAGADLAKQALADPKVQADRWPVGAVTSKTTTDSARRSSYQRIYAVNLEQVQGDNPLAAIVDQRTNNLVIRDGLGRTRQTLPLTQGQRYYTSNYALTRGRKVGHLLLLNMGYELIAVDTLKSGGEGILWRKQLYEQGGNGTRITINQLRAVQRNSPFGLARKVPGDMTNRIIPIAGPSGRNGVIYQASRDLICADVITGEVIWSRANMPVGAELLGDGNVLLVAPPNGGDAKMYSAIDGRELGSRPIENLQSRWTNWGRNTLAFKPEGRNIQLRLYDVTTGDTLWEATYEDTARGALVGGDEVAIMKRSGELTIVSLADGSVSLETTLLPESALAHLQVLRSSSQYTVVPSQNQSARTNGTVMAAPSNTYTVPMINGRIYAFDRESGEAVWQSPAIIEDFSLPLGQPTESPVLLLIRNERLRIGGRSQQTFSGVAIDRRDGSLLFHEESTPGLLSLYEMTGDPEKKSVSILLGNRRTTLQFTNEWAPPQPAVQMADRPSNAAEQARDAVKQAADALFRNLVPLP